MKLAKFSTKFSKKQIFLLSIPVFFSNLAIPLVGIVDTGLMGNLGETKYLAATSIATSVMTMVIWSFGFLRMGTVGIVSQAYGRGDYREIVRTLLRNFVIAMAIALLIIILKPLINISIQHFFNTSLETQNLINKDTLEYFPTGAVITNVARGDIVDDEALIDALNRRKIYAAGLDVYKNEPNLNPGYLKIKDVLTHQAQLISWIPFYRQTLEQDSENKFIKLRDTLYSKFENEIYPIRVADSIYLHFSFPDSIIKQIIDSELLEKKEYVYSDLGYYLLKEIIEDLTQESFDDYLNNNFYKKIGMENLGFLPKKCINTDRIVPTENDYEFRSQLLKGDVHDMGAAMFGGIGGHAGLFSNANDLAKIMQLYINKGSYGGEFYFSSEIIDEYTKCQFCQEENRRGLGFDKPALENQEGGPTCKCVSELSFGHSGFTGTLAWADPETQIIYIFLSNRIHPNSDNKKLLDLNVRTDIMEQIFKYNER